MKKVIAGCLDRIFRFDSEEELEQYLEKQDAAPWRKTRVVCKIRVGDGYVLRTQEAYNHALLLPIPTDSLNDRDPSVQIASIVVNKQNEEIFRMLQNEYLKQDAERQAEEFLEANERVLYEFTSEDYENLVERFERSQSCNVPENSTWQEVIFEYMKEKHSEELIADE